MKHAEDLLFQVYGPFLSLLDIQVPIIAAMNGHAVGGGLGLALVCDMRIANKSSKYGANFVRLGLHPGMASTCELCSFTLHRFLNSAPFV